MYNYIRKAEFFNEHDEKTFEVEKETGFDVVSLTRFNNLLFEYNVHLYRKITIT